MCPSGVAGGIVAQPFFQQHFGLLGADGKPISSRTDSVSSNVVSVLQAGAFFGALGSVPLSDKIGRKWTLLVFSLVFAVGAVSAFLEFLVGGMAHAGLDSGHAGWR